MSQSALWVCVTCRGRKKGCDKQLPKCGYCTRRGLACVYHDAPPSHEQEYPESRTSSMVRSDSQGWQGSLSISWARRRSSNSPTSSALEPPASLYEFLGSVSNGGAAGGGGASGGLDDLLNREVASIFQDQKLTLPELTERYFRGFHKWLPIVSPTRFHEAAAQTGTGRGTPLADFRSSSWPCTWCRRPKARRAGTRPSGQAPRLACRRI